MDYVWGKTRPRIGGRPEKFEDAMVLVFLFFLSILKTVSTLLTIENIKEINCAGNAMADRERIYTRPDGPNQKTS